MPLNTNDPADSNSSESQPGQRPGRIETQQSEFLEKLEAHRFMLLRVCWAYTWSPHDRDDLYQEIVGRLWGAYPSFDPTRRFSTWMYRVALNVAIDFRRRSSRRASETTGHETANHTGVQQDSKKFDQLEELHEHLERLPDLDRAIVVLVLEGHSYRDIAEIVGISESNIGSRLHRTKDQLRRAVEPNR